MSKSLGNIIKARDFITDYNSEILKILILNVHYRSVLNFNESQINNSITNLIKIYSSINLADSIIVKQKNQKEDIDFKNFIHTCEEKTYEFMNNDFNTPGFFSIIFEPSFLLETISEIVVLTLLPAFMISFVVSIVVQLSKNRKYNINRNNRIALMYK